MKKAVSLLASFALAFSLLGAPVMGFADEGTDQAANTESTAPTKGLVEVRLTTKLVDPTLTGGLTVTLMPNVAGTAPIASFGFKAKRGNELSENGYVAQLADVEPGVYTLEVKGNGFIDYCQYGVVVKAGKRGVIELVDQYSDVLCDCDEHKANPILADKCVMRGLIPYGNLDGVGTRIDNGDAKALLQVITQVRAREDRIATSEENAKYGLNLVRETTTSQPEVEDGVGGIEGHPPIGINPATQTADIAVLSEDGPEDAVEDDIDLETEVKLANGAGGEDPNVETPGSPVYRAENATEDVLTSAEEAAAAALEEAAEEGAEAGVPDGTISRMNATAPIALGLNAFQQLATMMGAQAIAGEESHIVDTSNMQASWDDKTTNLVIDSGKELADVLFNDDGETVKMEPVSGDISTTNPVELSVDAQGAEMDTIAIAIPSDSPNAPTAGEVTVESTDGAKFALPFTVSNTQGQSEATVNLFAASSYAAAADGEARLSFFDDGAATKKEPSAAPNKTGDAIIVDLGNQIPVKIITIKVTATSSKKLAEIAHVEFLNKMEDKIGEADLNIPKVKTFKVTTGNKTIGLEWAKEREGNVTGYEVEISLKGSAMVIGTAKNSISITNFNGKELVNYTTYTLRVRSTNDDWRSPWSATVTATPEATGKPMAPAAPTVKGQYNSIVVNWKQAVDAEWYKVYYKKHTDSTYQAHEVEKGTMRFVIENLELSTTYDVRVSGKNVHGEGPKSPEVSATTTPDKVKVPWYKLINREAMNKTIGSSYANNIEKVEADYNKGGDPKNMVDGDYDTYVSGAKGGYYHGGTVTFTKPYDLDTIMLTGYQAQSLNIYDMIVEAWDSRGNAIKPNGKKIQISVTNYSSKTRTVMIRTEKLTDVKKIHVAYQRSVGNAWSASTIAELAFYDTTLYSDTMALWADAEHTVLRDDVTMQTIQSFIKEATTPDPDCNEYHPSQSLILAELANAEAVCNNQALRTPMKVDPKLNVNGSQAKRGVGGLNGWQPTGVAVEAGDEIAVYVGKKGETSRAVPLAFYVVQNHPELSNGFVTRLMPADGSGVKVGMNTFLVPEGLTSINMERGGNLYVVYDTAANSSDQYTVRVSGGSYVPVLDVHNLSGDARTDAIKAYVKEVGKYDPEAEHKKRVAEGRHDTYTTSTNYDAKNCIANATDIVMNDMMYSIPVSAVKSALGLTSSSADQDAAAQKLTKSINAMEDMMKLFYQHKGFVKNASDAEKQGYGSNNAWPTLHQNIRYVRCSGKVFMYAAGNHIGIQWGSTTGVVSAPGVTLDSVGRYESGNYFGWGVAHEIGHEINQGCYTYAEVTNNYYAQLAQAMDGPTNFKTRWDNYDTIYKRVASGAKGAAGGKTGIAMYWQLHLAYDDDYNYTTYDNAADQYNNLVFARIDAYARNTASAPQAANEKAHPLTLKGANKDNALMRLACAATQKNLLDFFQAWGLTPDDETKAYAAQWPEEERAIQYQTDALRLYRLGRFNGGDIFGLTSKQAEGKAKEATVTATLDYTPIANRPHTTHDQTIKVNLADASIGSDILGYEILRNGQVIGFLRANDFDNCRGKFAEDKSATFSDTINTVNNRVFKYEVRAVDKLLGRGNLVLAGEVKVSHPNSLSKENWTATTNMGSGDVMPNETYSVTGTMGGESVVLDVSNYGEDDPLHSLDTDEEATVDSLVASAIDGDASTVFSGTVPSATNQSDARITINFGEIVSVVGMRVQGASVGGPYRIETSSDGETWTQINTGTIAGDDAIYFTRDADEYLYGHDAAYLRLTVPGQSSFSVSEIDVLGPQGDDAEFRENGIGLLQNTEKLGTTESKAEATIPAGSLVFVGTYKGNPAYNALLLYNIADDGTTSILGGVGDDGSINAKEVIFAPPVVDNGKLGDVAEGYWVYYIEPQYLTGDWQNQIKNVKAELYRVDNAHTLEGQRLVADTLSVAVPAKLDELDLSFGKIPTPEEQGEASDPQTEERTALDAMGIPSDPSGHVSPADEIGAFAYDFSEIYRPDGTVPSDDLGSFGTPLYDTPDVNFDDISMGSRISGDTPMGTAIYDDATPLASPRHENNRLAKATARSLAETFLVVLEDTNVVNIVKNLG